jgi:hypothetical protein
MHVSGEKRNLDRKEVQIERIKMAEKEIDTTGG